MQEILDFLQLLDWSPLVISIKTGIVATILSFFFGIFAARAVMKLRPGARAVIDGFLTLPMILPPTVAGFFLLLIFSLRRPFGAALYENFSIKAVQTWLGCILAATIIAFPLMYRNTRAAFEQVDTNLIYAARTLGMSEWKIFWKVVIPSAGPGVLSGTVLAFARALGEYGATSMLAGNIPGLLPIGTIFLTPLFGTLYDRIGKGATLMIIGAVMLIGVHTLFALPILNVWWFATVIMIVLGIAFSLVPSAMWPSVPKIIPEKQLGTAYALIFWVQNWGLMGVPLLIGWVLNTYCKGPVVDGAQTYDYTLPMAIFACFGVLALIVALMLKAEDKKKGYGLQEANIKK